MAATKTRTPAANERVILALDVDTADEALALIERCGPGLRFVKVGWQLFLGAGTPLIERLARDGLRVFLDLKIGDVDNTVAAAARSLARLPVELLTLNGNAATVAAAVSGRGEQPTPGVLLVTLLSSWDAGDLGAGGDFDVPGYAGRRAVEAVDAGATGVVASGESVQQVRKMAGDRPCLIVTPGVRPADSEVDEHKRVLTPERAIALGADLLVVGRPIRTATDPRAAFDAIVAAVDGATR